MSFTEVAVSSCAVLNSHHFSTALSKLLILNFCQAERNQVRSFRSKQRTRLLKIKLRKLGNFFFTEECVGRAYISGINTEASVLFKTKVFTIWKPNRSQSLISLVLASDTLADLFRYPTGKSVIFGQFPYSAPLNWRNEQGVQAKEVGFPQPTEVYSFSSAHDYFIQKLLEYPNLITSIQL